MRNTIIADSYPRNAHLPHHPLQSQSDDLMEFIQLSTDSQRSQQQQRQILFQHEVESEKKKNLLLLL
jgi:hypothetical protein